jgi:uncharacterized protein YijF (DUF1287 family)
MRSKVARTLILVSVLAALVALGSWLAIGRVAAHVALPVDTASAEAHRFALAAEKQVGVTVSYDSAYVELTYPGGDVPIETGVCTDVVVRAMREMGVDLQVEVHEDMVEAFGEYPRTWRLTEPDPNIDHRRVPNLQVFFERRGMSLPVTDVAADYQPGDIVTWKMPGGRPHVGVVAGRPVRGRGRFAIVHNAGWGTRVEDILFAYPITGHYRWF